MPNYVATVSTTFETCVYFKAPDLKAANEMYEEFMEEECFLVRLDTEKWQEDLEERDISTVLCKQDLVGIQHCDYFYGNEEGDEEDEFEELAIDGRGRLVAESLTLVDES